SALVALPVLAEQPQLPNNGFEDGWGACTPWTSNGNSKTEGTTPGDWTISQVIGINGIGKTTVGEKVAGYNSASAVKVYNNENPVKKSEIVPGYVTLGKTWSTSTGMVTITAKDGGTFEGYDFTGRPEKITFMYKFERESENTQPANAIVYLWKGSTTQADVPGNIATSASGIKKVSMVDRDRNILGIETSTGGTITKSSDFELIAKGTTVITEATSEWVKGEIVLEYFSDATPEKINAIFAANNYFDSNNITKGNALTIDDVQCVYSTEPTPGPEGKPFPGKLEVYCELLGGYLTADGGEDATVYINPLSENTCSFLLPDLTLGDIGTIGDISLPEVNISIDNNDLSTFTAHVDDLSLLDGNIHAAVTLNGTVDKDGTASFKIDVLWTNNDPQIPIIVTFNGKGNGGFTGVSDITVDDANAPVLYYNLQGVRVDNPQNGLYIRVQGKKATKVAIR
ncbi:MAG: calycin-like domain-containing protein, partial [Muribaculaceae bacterium]